MTLTDEQLEQAAIELRMSRGQRVNDEDALDYTKDEIQRWLQIQEAVNRVVGK